MPQFFVEQLPQLGESTEISGEDAKHIAKVLRLNVGERLVLSAGDGRSFWARILSVHPKGVQVKLEEERPFRQPATELTLAQAIIKHDGFEWIVQKAVELGVTQFIPFVSERCVPQWSEGVAQKKLDRWKQIALAAAKQSGCPFLPQVSAPFTFSKLLEQSQSFDDALFLWESERYANLKVHLRTNKPKKRLLIIGPEGGFSQDEAEAAKTAGAKVLSLGPQILRVETAALASITLCQYEQGGLENA